MDTVLGIDPGLANFGWAAAEIRRGSIIPLTMGLIRTDKSDKKLKVLASDDNVRRAREISAELRKAVEEYSPLAFCVEAKSFPPNASAAAKTALTWGIIVAMAEGIGLPIFQASPQQIKIKMCGSKSASKSNIQDAVDDFFGKDVVCSAIGNLPKTKKEHPYDALASIVTCADTEAFRFFRNMLTR